MITSLLGKWDLHLSVVHLEELVAFIVLEVHDIVDRFNTCVLTTLDDLDYTCVIDRTLVKFKKRLTSGSK